MAKKLCAVSPMAVVVMKFFHEKTPLSAAMMVLLKMRHEPRPYLLFHCGNVLV